MVKGDEIKEILGVSLARIRIANVHSYTGGTHKSIKGCHTINILPEVLKSSASTRMQRENYPEIPITR